jgi:hypothetical protein
MHCIMSGLTLQSVSVNKQDFSLPFCVGQLGSNVACFLFHPVYMLNMKISQKFTTELLKALLFFNISLHVCQQ